MNVIHMGFGIQHLPEPDSGTPTTWVVHPFKTLEQTFIA